MVHADECHPHCLVATRLAVLTFCVGFIYSYRSTFCSFGFSNFLNCWRRQQAGDALVEIEQEGHAFDVGGVGLFAAAGLVGGVYGGV